MLKLLAISIFLTAACCINRVDKQHRRQGLWIMHYDDNKKQLMWRGRYKNHHQIGHWKYYTSSGTLYLDECYQKHKMIKTIYYDSLGRKQLTGYANYYETLDTAYYRWEGDWLKYDTTGALIQVSYYKFGKFAWYKPINSVKH